MLIDISYPVRLTMKTISWIQKSEHSLHRFRSIALIYLYVLLELVVRRICNTNSATHNEVSNLMNYMKVYVPIPVFR